jgi:O-antigen/teichoic acid export membrane protein
MNPDHSTRGAEHESRSFFRQSGWMMFAGVAGGACMFAVHFFAKAIPRTEYGYFGTLLSIFNMVGIPGMGMQMLFVQQAASAIHEDQQRRLATMTRTVIAGTFGIWVLMALFLLIYGRAILGQLQMENLAALWITLLTGLLAIWSPIFSGLLQGQQNFFWLGWAQMLAGLGRVAAVAFIVLVLGGFSTGMMTGALIGSSAALTVLMWHTRKSWLGPGAPVEWKPWLRRAIPLTLGFGASTFLQSADPLFVQTYFEDTETGFYMAAGTLSRAIVLFTGPLAAVMFPKIVRSVARAEKTDLMKIALATTCVLAGGAALGLSVLGPWILPLVFTKAYLAVADLLPWFAWSMVPLALANVLINNLLARERFAIVPGLVVLAVGYGLSLANYHDTFLVVVRTLGSFNLLALALAAWFTWGRSAR